MMTAAQASKEAQNLGKQLKSVIKVGNYLAELGSLEQALAEAEPATARAKKAQAEAEKQLAQTEDQLQIAADALVVIKQDAQVTERESVIAAEHLVADARKTATEIVDLAAAEADQLTVKMQARIKVLGQERDALAQDTKRLRVKSVNLRTEMTALKERLG